MRPTSDPRSLGARARTARFILTRLCRLACLLAAALFVPAGAAQAEATVLRFEFITPFTDFVVSDDCRPELSAIVTGTETLVGQRVETPPPSSGYRLHGQITATFTFQFSDGSYGVGESTDHFAAPFVLTGLGQETAISVITFAHVDTVTVYDAGGRVIGTNTFRVIEHITFNDVAPLGGPPDDNDIVRVSFDRARLVCDV
jgi:hypothetical protein